MSAYGRLAEYNRKRHFDVTPEPPGTARARQSGRPARVRRPEAPGDRPPLRLSPGAPRRDALLGGPEGSVARSRREAARHGDRAAPDGLQPVRGRDPRGRVRRRDRDDLGQGGLGADRSGSAGGRDRGRPPAQEGRPQVRAAGGEAPGLVGARPDARRPAVAPHQAPGRLREPGGSHGLEAPVGRVRALDGRDRRSPPARARASSSKPPAPIPPRSLRPRALAGRRRRDGRRHHPGRAASRARPHGARRGLARLPGGSAPAVVGRLEGRWIGGLPQDGRPATGPRAVGLLADGHGHRGDPRRRARRPAHQSPQGVLAGARAHEARPAPVLRRRGARPAAASPGPRHGDEALPERGLPGVLLHEAGARAASAVARPLPDRAQLGQRHRLPRRPGPALAPLGGQPRLHRPQPVVRPVRRRGPARLRPLRPRSRDREDRGAVRPPARGRAHGAGRPRGAGHAGLREDHGLPRLSRVRADRARADPEGRLGVRETAGAGARRGPSGAPDRGVPHPEAAGGTRPGRLQPERLGADAGVRLFGPAPSARARVDARHVGRGRAGRPARGSPRRERSRRACGRAATCGRRSWPTRSGCASRPCPEPRGRRGVGDPRRDLRLALRILARRVVSGRIATTTPVDVVRSGPRAPAPDRTSPRGPSPAPSGRDSLSRWRPGRSWEAWPGP